jgi:hypothetical protein
MKRFFLAIFVASLSFALFAYDAEVIEIQGRAQVSSNGTSWSPLNVGSVISQGATIQTAFKSSLKFKLKGTTVNVGAMTRIKVEELSESPSKDNAVLSVKTGSLVSNVKKVEDRRVGFTIKGPAATASVRGTIFGIECRYKSDTVTGQESQTAVWATVDGQEISFDGNSINGTCVVWQGQSVSVGAEGGQDAPIQKAISNAYDLGGAVPLAAREEAVGASPSALPAPDGPAGGNVAAGTGSIAVAVVVMN